MSEGFTTAGGTVVPTGEFEVTSVRSSGPGGQNVNKVSSAIHLRYDIGASSLSTDVRERLAALKDRRISADGVIVIKAQNHRTRERNLKEALARLGELIDRASVKPSKRIPTKPGRAARERRLTGKKQRSEIKQLRRKPID